MTPLHVAAKGNRVETVESLVCRGADINIRNNKGVKRPDLYSRHFPWQPYPLSVAVD